MVLIAGSTTGLRINSVDLCIDDYAHHPEELRATILSAKELNPDKNTTVVFQPHLFSRTRDFANAFSDVLSLADQVILLPIYPARELPISGVTSQILADKITTEVTLCNKDALIDVLKTMHIEVLLTLGAGDIDQLVNPISDFLIQRYG
jgi:UDP-N-acetylmuramate--alanine ligase